MVACTFIGHKDVPKEIEPILESTLIDLILNKGVTEFFVGTHGGFDFLVQRVLKKLKTEYSHISYTIVLAYLTNKNLNYDYRNTVFPEALENTPPKFAIDRRNKWMIKNSQYLVCYVRHPYSNSHRFKEYAKRQNKIIINLHEKKRL